ncbi:PLP-dependent transferase [Candidatus Uhrbacteria bacterium]|nr:PLP-dependent transferase [Candidatus Uhrbacteria bacterium]
MIAETRVDLAQDFEELLFLARSGKQSLEKFLKDLRRHPEFVQDHIRPLLFETGKGYEKRYQEIESGLRRELRRKHDGQDTSSLIQKKCRTMHELRALAGLRGALLCSADWQSPSFMHALFSEAGMQTGKITGTINDYKRDQNLDAAGYEERFVKEYIEAPLHLTPHAYATSSGMAAFTTVVNYLVQTGAITSPVLVGRESYFENKGILRKTFSGLMHFVDEMDTDAVLRAVEEHAPAAIFLDTICNTERVAAPDFSALIPRLAKAVKRPTFIVLDNSAAGVMYQPLQDFPVLFTNLRLIVVESLNKFYQFGFDRVTGGIIWSVGPYVSGLFSARVHLGTNLPDASARALAEPNKGLLVKRLGRISRNAEMLAHTLDKHLETQTNSPLSHVVYPGLPAHPAYAWMGTRPFKGAFFVLVWKPGQQTVEQYKKFLRLAIEEAKRAHVPLIAGTSFGFNTTRVYLTALHAEQDTNPFIRISPGTETIEEIHALAEIFKKAINRL